MLNKTRNTGITVIGGFRKFFTKPLYMLAQTTNLTDFHSFVTQIRSSLPRSQATAPIHIVLDNHRAHHTLVVREYCKHHKLELTFQPSYSPEFNSIETLWSIIKRRFKQQLVAEVDVHSILPSPTSNNYFRQCSTWSQLRKYAMQQNLIANTCFRR